MSTGLWESGAIAKMLATVARVNNVKNLLRGESSEKALIDRRKYYQYVFVVVGVLVAASMMHMISFHLADDYRLIGIDKYENVNQMREEFFSHNRIIWYVLLDQHIIAIISNTPELFYGYNVLIFSIGYFGFFMLFRKMKRDWIAFIILLSVILTPAFSDVFYRLSPGEKYYFALTPYVFLFIPTAGSKTVRQYILLLIVAALYVSVKELGFVILSGLGLHLLIVDWRSGGFHRYARAFVIFLPIIIFLAAVALLYNYSGSSHAQDARPDGLGEILMQVAISGGNALLFSPLIVVTIVISFIKLRLNDRNEDWLMLVMLLLASGGYLLLHIVFGVGIEFRYILPVLLVLIYPAIQIFQALKRPVFIAVASLLFLLAVNSTIMYAKYSMYLKHGSSLYQQFLANASINIRNSSGNGEAILWYPGRAERREMHNSIETYLSHLYMSPARFVIFKDTASMKFELKKIKDAENSFSKSKNDRLFLIFSKENVALKSQIRREIRLSNLEMILLYSNLSSNCQFLNPPLNVFYRRAISMANGKKAGGFFDFVERTNYGWEIYRVTDPNGFVNADFEKSSVRQ